MHIVQVLASLNLGGSELVAVELAEFAARQGHEVTVLAESGPLLERIETAGAHHLDCPIGRKRLSTLKYIRLLQGWLERVQPDVVHVHSRFPAWICHQAVRRMDKRLRPAIVSSMHGRYSVNRYSAIMVRADRIICVSSFIRDYTLENYPQAEPGSVEVIHGGVNPEAFPFGYKPSETWFERTWEAFPELRGKTILCLPGRLSKYKGHMDFMSLISALRHSGFDVQGVVVGKARHGSRFFKQLQNQARRQGVEGAVTFVGARTDMRDWMACSKIVYNLSADPPEAFGRTVPEALFLGVPVIAWDHGGVHETLARLFPQGAVAPGSHDRLLERSIEFLSNPPDIAPPRAFSLAESMAATMRVYRSLAN